MGRTVIPHESKFVEIFIYFYIPLYTYLLNLFIYFILFYTQKEEDGGSSLSLHTLV